MTAPEVDAAAEGPTPAHEKTSRRSVLGSGWALTMAGLGYLLTLLIRIYQSVISPLLGPSCRFYPSCSSYAVTALQVHGPFVGVYLIGARLIRCNPWNYGGVDDVPPKGWRHRRSEHVAGAP